MQEYGVILNNYLGERYFQAIALFADLSMKKNQKQYFASLRCTCKKQLEKLSFCIRFKLSPPPLSAGGIDSAWLNLVGNGSPDHHLMREINRAACAQRQSRTDSMIIPPSP